MLFPPPPPPPFSTRPDPVQERRVYSTAAVDKCGECGGERVFECQLMPNVINVLCKGVETQIEWGTVMVFSCENDCCRDEEAWREEQVLVQWDD